MKVSWSISPILTLKLVALSDRKKDMRSVIYNPNTYHTIR